MRGFRLYRHSLLAGILQFSRCRVPAVVESKTDWSCKTEFWHSITNTIRPRSRYSSTLLQLLIPYFYYLPALGVSGVESWVRKLADVAQWTGRRGRVQPPNS